MFRASPIRAAPLIWVKTGSLFVVISDQNMDSHEMRRRRRRRWITGRRDALGYNFWRCAKSIRAMNANANAVRVCCVEHGSVSSNQKWSPYFLSCCCICSTLRVSSPSCHVVHRLLMMPDNAMGTFTFIAVDHHQIAG